MTQNLNSEKNYSLESIKPKANNQNINSHTAPLLSTEKSHTSQGVWRPKQSPAIRELAQFTSTPRDKSSGSWNKQLSNPWSGQRQRKCVQHKPQKRDCTGRGGKSAWGHPSASLPVYLLGLTSLGLGHSQMLSLS